MTIENRAFALDAATKLNLGDAVTTIAAAKLYNEFLIAGAAEAAPKPAGKVGTAPKSTRKTEDEVVKAALEKQRAEAEAADGDEPEQEQTDGGEEEEALPATKEGAQAAVAQLLKSNKRKEAISLLKKFGATSVGGLKPKDFAKFVKEAIAALKPAAAEGADDDLTA